MKHTYKILIGLGVLAAATPAFADVDWGFDTSGSPPGSYTLIGGTAVVSTSADGIGYINTDPAFGSAQGYWDLGPGGTILLSGVTAQSYTITIHQWVDSPGIFAGDMKFKVGSGPDTLFTFAGLLPPSGDAEFGRWREYQSTLNLMAGQSITIMSPGSGAIVDRVMLTVVPEPATMIAGALLLIPFAFSTIRIVRRHWTVGDGEESQEELEVARPKAEEPS